VVQCCPVPHLTGGIAAPAVDDSTRCATACVICARAHRLERQVPRDVRRDISAGARQVTELTE
jgi:hypothetical protein